LPDKAFDCRFQIADFEPMDTCTLTARWLFPVDGPPLERGTLTIAGDRIVSVQPRGERRADVDFGDAAILPGLVNAHTHLDLSGLRGKLQPGLEFTQWLRAIVRHRRALTWEQAAEDIKAGIAESLTAGTTLIGDISSQGWSWAVLAEAPLRAVVFYELIGLSEIRAMQAAEDARSWLAAHPATDNCRPAISPHAPYSVRASLFQSAAEVARHENIPLASHLAETSAELELLQHRRGPLVEFLLELSAWEPGGLVRDLDEVLSSFAGIRNVLCIHANFGEESSTLLSSPTRVADSPTVVYCPRTHAAFGHPPHPFREYAKAGIRVALATDSLASNPDLSLLTEARFFHRKFPDVPGEIILRMITLFGAEALGWDQKTGSLTAGKSADLVVLPLPPQDSEDPHDLLFRSNRLVRRAMVRGRWVYEEKPIF
jgi:cytosine/adenosine deaminase-related metal-dependent hydrolase